MGRVVVFALFAVFSVEMLRFAERMDAASQAQIGAIDAQMVLLATR